MGSSYFRIRLAQSALWIWNAFSPSDDALSRWIKVFGSKPKLMENVNPKLRAQVAEHQLDKWAISITYG